MATLIVIAGLSGSGKTTYIKSLRGQISGIVADDYQGRSSSRKFVDSRYFVELVGALNAGKDCIACDITFCRAGQRAEFEAVILGAAPRATFEWRFFENDPERCLANVRRRVRLQVSAEEESIRSLAPCYEIPAGAVVLPVWRPAGT